MEIASETTPVAVRTNNRRPGRDSSREVRRVHLDSANPQGGEESDMQRIRLDRKWLRSHRNSFVMFGTGKSQDNVVLKVAAFTMPAAMSGL